MLFVIVAPIPADSLWRTVPYLPRRKILIFKKIFHCPSNRLSNRLTGLATGSIVQTGS